MIVDDGLEPGVRKPAMESLAVNVRRGSCGASVRIRVAPASAQEVAETHQVAAHGEDVEVDDDGPHRLEVGRRFRGEPIDGRPQNRVHLLGRRGRLACSVRLGTLAADRELERDCALLELAHGVHVVRDEPSSGSGVSSGVADHALIIREDRVEHAHPLASLQDGHRIGRGSRGHQRLTAENRLEELERVEDRQVGLVLAAPRVVVAYGFVAVVAGRETGAQGRKRRIGL